MKQDKESSFMYWLYSIDGLGRKKIEMLLRICKTAKGVYLFREDMIDEFGFLTKRDKEALKAAKQNMDIQKDYKEMKEKNISFLTLKNRKYPEKLKYISDAPFGIFYSGKLPNPDLPSVAIIGSRQCTEYGRYVAAQLGAAFAKANIQVISGMARGIDSIAQAAAMEAGGHTFGILGCGVDICYPPECKALYKKLKENGGLISEYPPGTEPKAQYFPRRNRIISGLSDAVVVVEARERSGTLITVDMALEQGREVYVVPGRMTDPLSVGCNRLIRQGAEIVNDISELIHDVWQLHERQWSSKTDETSVLGGIEAVGEENDAEGIQEGTGAACNREKQKNVESMEEKTLETKGLSEIQRKIVRMLYMEGKGIQGIYTELLENTEVDIATLSDELFRLEQMGKILHSEGYYYLRER